MYTPVNWTFDGVKIKIFIIICDIHHFVSSERCYACQMYVCFAIIGNSSPILLQIIQLDRFTGDRIISHVGCFDHTEPLFSILQIMNIYQINTCMCCTLMFKHNKAMLPTLFNDIFVLSLMTHKYNTRQKFAYKIPFCTTKCRQLSLAYVGPKYGTPLS